MYVSIFRAMMMNCLGVFLMLTAACVAGISVFAFYADRGCDPLANKDIKNPNQVSRHSTGQINGSTLNRTLQIRK